jgi:LAO/AO transport system kinase
MASRVHGSTIDADDIVVALTTAGDLAERVRAGDARAIARAITLIENDAPDAAAIVAAVFPQSGRAHLVGVTGPPGAGKSTLVDRLTGALRKGTPSGDPKTVGVIAVDPSSPYSGGAVLGDRLRMQAHAEDAGVFIRSMATRGHLGGLARATADAALVLDAAGKDLVLIETVGVGQDEVDVVRTADVSLVVLVPGTGDDVQALKAGLMEIADIFIVNKADREGADSLVSAIEGMLSLQTYGAEEWRPPIIKTTATTGAGIDEVIGAIERHRTYASRQPVSRESSAPTRFATRRRARHAARLRELVTARFMDRLEHDVLGPGEFDALVERIDRREVDPYTAADALLERAAGERRH